MYNILFILVLFISLPLYGITLVFSHGLGDTGIGVISYLKENTQVSLIAADEKDGKRVIPFIVPPSSFYLFSGPVHTFNYEFAPETQLRIKKGKVHFEQGIKYPNKVTLGQHNEIQTLDREVKCINDSCILFGRSLGAATILTYLAEKQPQNIKAVIVEAPFDTVESVVNYHSLNNFLGIGNFLRKNIYPAYNSHGITPLQAVTSINRNIPILIIHSRHDEVIPVKSSRRLFMKMRKAGYEKVHYFELRHAGHNTAPISKDAQKYQQIVNAFFKKYGLPYDENYAAHGEKLFRRTQQPLKHY